MKGFLWLGLTSSPVAEDVSERAATAAAAALKWRSLWCLFSWPTKSGVLVLSATAVGDPEDKACLKGGGALCLATGCSSENATLGLLGLATGADKVFMFSTSPRQMR